MIAGMARTIEPRKLAVFTPDQMHRLIEAVKPRHRAAIVTGFGTGLRQAELLGLTIENVNLLRRELLRSKVQRCSILTSSSISGPSTSSC